MPSPLSTQAISMKLALVNEQATLTAPCPTARAWCLYTDAEIENLDGHWDAAESHYRQSHQVAQEAGTTFVQAVASLGLISVQAKSGQITAALHGYRRLINYWERTGSWTQQWTTLRNIASLFDQLGDHEIARFLRASANEAPEAAALTDTERTVPDEDGADTHRSPHVPADTTCKTREQVLDVVRDAIDRKLAASSEA